MIFEAHLALMLTILSILHKVIDLVISILPDQIEQKEKERPGKLLWGGNSSAESEAEYRLPLGTRQGGVFWLAVAACARS